MDTHLVYFSPTDTTSRVLHIMFDNLFASQTPVEHNLTSTESSGIQIGFSANDLVVFGTPVYSGRVPKTAADRFRNLQGSNTPAILIVTYGNRDYDDALVELFDFVMSQGFIVIAAAAVVTEHSVVRKIATGRPNKNDQELIKGFSDKIKKKSFTEELITPLKGNRPYRQYQSIPFKPKGNSRCVNCGLCTRLCPVDAIPQNNPQNTDRSLCISCMRCVRYCSKSARGLSKIEQYIADQFVAGKCKGEKENILYL